MKINLTRIKKPEIYVPLLISLSCGIFLFCLALLSRDLEWWISEISAEIIDTAFLKYREFPFFSYFHNGGSMIIQDPQGHLLSPATLFILLFGPQIGLRVMALVWGFIGCLSAYYWFGSKIGKLAAIITACAWTLNMVILMQLVNGNDMFLWYLGLPLFLIAIEKIVLKPSWRTTSLSGLLVAMYILGPSFHALLYLIIPISIVWFIFLFTKHYKEIDKKELLHHIIVVIGIGIIIALPKIYAWTQLDMSRSTDPQGNMLILEALHALIDIRPSLFINYFDIAGEMSIPFFTGNTALPPIATILAIVGFFVAWKKKLKQKFFLAFSIVLISIGLLISVNDAVWELFRAITNNNFQFAPRFLAVSSFGIAILSGIGTSWLLKQFPKYRKIIAGILITSTFVFGIIWINQTSKYVVPNFGNLITGPISSLLKFDRTSLIKDDFTGVIQSGSVIYPGIIVTGSEISVAETIEKRDELDMIGDATYLSPELIPDNRLIIYNTKLFIKNLKPQEVAHIRLNSAPLGETIHTTPENADVTLEIINDELVLTNHENYVIEIVEIKPNSPVPTATWIISIIALISTVSCILVLTVRNKK